MAAGGPKSAALAARLADGIITSVKVPAVTKADELVSGGAIGADAAAHRGALETIAYLKARDIRIGSTTGYTRSIMAHVLPVTARQGYEPENLVCADDLPEGTIGALAAFGDAIGLAFQIQDDILDVIGDTETLGKPQGSDEELNKPTYPALLGLLIKGGLNPVLFFFLASMVIPLMMNTAGWDAKPPGDER